MFLYHVMARETGQGEDPYPKQLENPSKSPPLSQGPTSALLLGPAKLWVQTLLKKGRRLFPCLCSYLGSTR